MSKVIRGFKVIKGFKVIRVFRVFKVIRVIKVIRGLYEWALFLAVRPLGALRAFTRGQLLGFCKVIRDLKGFYERALFREQDGCFPFLDIINKKR